MGILILTSSEVIASTQEVNIQIEGAVKARCGFEQGEAISTGTNSGVLFDINPEDTNWANQKSNIAVSLACNAPFTLAVRSSHGGLVNQTSQTKHIGGNFSNDIAYELAVTITTEDTASPLVLACSSRDMINSHTNCGASSGNNAAIGTGAGIGDVAISLSGSAGFPIRGRYQDTIVLALAFQ